MKYFIMFVACCLLLAGCSDAKQEIKEELNSNTDTKDYSFTQVITYTEDSGVVTITKHKLTKKADIDMVSYVDSTEYRENKQMVEYSMGFLCSLMQKAMFDKDSEEFEATMDDWGSREYTVEDDSPDKETTIGENPLEGYTVTTMTITLSDKDSKNEISECDITGPDESQMKVTVN